MSNQDFSSVIPRTNSLAEKRKKAGNFFLQRRRPIKKTTQTDWLIRLVTLVFFAATVYTIFIKVEYKWDYFQGDTAMKMVTNFLRFDKVGLAKMMEMLGTLINTLALGFLTTFLGLVAGLMVGVFAAKNLVKGLIPNVIRSLASLIRAVPTIIWVLIMVAGFGLTATTAVVGMFFHTLAFFIKSFSEAFEEVDEGTLEALRSTGANWLQIVLGAVLPSSFTKVISWVAIRSEINFGVAIIIGPATGVPGTIGTIINNASRAGDYHIQGFGVFLIFLTAYIMEYSINRIRQKSII